VQALTSAKVSAENRALEALAKKEAAEAQVQELIVANTTAEKQIQELVVAKERAEEQVKDALAANEAIQAQVQALTSAKVSAENRALEALAKKEAAESQVEELIVSKERAEEQVEFTQAQVQELISAKVSAENCARKVLATKESTEAQVQELIVAKTTAEQQVKDVREAAVENANLVKATAERRYQELLKAKLEADNRVNSLEKQMSELLAAKGAAEREIQVFSVKDRQELAIRLDEAERIRNDSLAVAREAELRAQKAEQELREVSARSNAILVREEKISYDKNNDLEILKKEASTAQASLSALRARCDVVENRNAAISAALERERSASIERKAVIERQAGAWRRKLLVALARERAGIKNLAYDLLAEAVSGAESSACEALALTEPHNHSIIESSFSLSAENQLHLTEFNRNQYIQAFEVVLVKACEAMQTMCQNEMVIDIDALASTFVLKIEQLAQKKYKALLDLHIGASEEAMRRAAECWFTQYKQLCAQTFFARLWSIFVQPRAEILSAFRCWKLRTAATVFTLRERRAVAAFVTEHLRQSVATRSNEIKDEEQTTIHLEALGNELRASHQYKTELEAELGNAREELIRTHTEYEEQLTEIRKKHEREREETRQDYEKRLNITRDEIQAQRIAAEALAIARAETEAAKDEVAIARADNARLITEANRMRQAYEDSTTRLRMVEAHTSDLAKLNADLVRKCEQLLDPAKKQRKFPTSPASTTTNSSSYSYSTSSSLFEKADHYYFKINPTVNKNTTTSSNTKKKSCLTSSTSRKQKKTATPPNQHYRRGTTVASTSISPPSPSPLSAASFDEELQRTMAAATTVALQHEDVDTFYSY